MTRTLAALALALVALPASSTPTLSAAGPLSMLRSGAAELIGVRTVDTDGNAHQLGLADLAAVGPVAVVFMDPGCPISKRYGPRLNELAATAAERGVEFYGVLSDPTVSVAEAREYRAEFELEFPLLFDASGDLARRLEPTHVPEAFVVSKTDRIIYRGRIDDRFEAVGQLRASITSHELLDAITVISGGAGSFPKHADPVGCVFEAWDGERATPTYNRDVAPILAANCLECHREGDVGPFPLDTYESAKRRAKMISLVCADELMPPWFAEEGAGSFRDERRLSDLQVELLEAWAAAGAPEGDPEELLPAPEREDPRWRLGPPDLLVEIPVDFEVPGDGDDIYQYFVIPNELTEDRAITAIDFRPGDPSVVHHCLAYLDRGGKARLNDEATEEPGFKLFGPNAVRGQARFNSDDRSVVQHIAGWAPGTQPYRLPKGTGARLETGGDFVLEVHYHPTGKATTDRSALALYFADEPVERYTEGLVMGTENINIPPGNGNYWRHVWMELPYDMDLIEASPHMHYLGKMVEVTATLPDGLEEPLIKIDGWDFRWQGAYFYREPVSLPKGTRIDAYFQFDNSSTNPFNPSSPPIRVEEGWRTTDEMCLFFFTVVPEEGADIERIHEAMYDSFGRSGAME